MTCPYSTPDCTSGVAGDAPRCACGGYVKRCAHCPARNRAFARFCRECGNTLPSSRANWSAYKGGPRRLGVNPAIHGTDCITRPADLRLRLGDACRSLLGYDGHLVAVALNGVVEIGDPLRAKSVCRFQAQGPITAEPCIDDGILYLGTRGQLTAYELAAMTMEVPRVRPLWHLPVDGTPIHALTAGGGRLYVTLATAGRREVQVVEQQTARPLHGAPKMSWLAADPDGARTVFLSEDDGRVHLHVVDGVLATYPVPLQGLTEQPIAILGETIFAIFGDAHRLYRIDAATGEVEEPLEEDTQVFALTHDEAGEWDRDSVYVDTRGIQFSRAGIRDSLAPHERVTKGSPVIVRDCAVAVGMEDGRVLLYDVAQLPGHEVWRPGGNGGAAITALASFDSFIAAGTKDGVVEVRQLIGKGGAR